MSAVSEAMRASSAACLAGLLLGLPASPARAEDSAREFFLKYRLLPTLAREFPTAGQSLAALREKHGDRIHIGPPKSGGVPRRSAKEWADRGMSGVYLDVD